jgi:hypothetical protein
MTVAGRTVSVSQGANSAPSVPTGLTITSGSNE